MKIKFLLVFALLITSCSSFDTPPTDSGIEGQVFIGPLCPVVREGEKCPDQPYLAVLTISNTKGQRIVRIQTDENGRFKVPLHAGKYILHPESPNVLPFAGELTVIVEEGMFTQVVVNYDSGIR